MEPATGDSGRRCLVGKGVKFIMRCCLMGMNRWIRQRSLQWLKCVRRGAEQREDLDWVYLHVGPLPHLINGAPQITVSNSYGMRWSKQFIPPSPVEPTSPQRAPHLAVCPRPMVYWKIRPWGGLLDMVEVPGIRPVQRLKNVEGNSVAELRLGVLYNGSSPLFCLALIPHLLPAVPSPVECSSSMSSSIYQLVSSPQAPDSPLLSLCCSLLPASHDQAIEISLVTYASSCFTPHLLARHRIFSAFFSVFSLASFLELSYPPPSTALLPLHLPKWVPQTSAVFHPLPADITK